VPLQQGWFALDSIDLTGVTGTTLMLGWQFPPKYGFDFEIRLDAPDGKLLGKGALAPPAGKQNNAMVNIKLEPVTGSGYHTVYIVSKAADAKETARAGITYVQFK